MTQDLSIPMRKMPASPPPNAAPQYCPFLKNTGPEYIRQYLNHMTYVWTIHGNSFWIYLTDASTDILFCYAWDGSGWKYIKLDIGLIDAVF